LTIDTLVKSQELTLARPPSPPIIPAPDSWSSDLASSVIWVKPKLIVKVRNVRSLDLNHDENVPAGKNRDVSGFSRYFHREAGGQQWAVSLTGKADGVLASIANGEYSITLIPTAVFAAADGTTAMTAGETDAFFRLFGDINGDGAINLADEFQASKSFSSGGYVGDGFVTSI
jgi:hypothetical protein